MYSIYTLIMVALVVAKCFQLKIFKNKINTFVPVTGFVYRKVSKPNIHQYETISCNLLLLEHSYCEPYF